MSLGIWLRNKVHSTEHKAFCLSLVIGSDDLKIVFQYIAEQFTVDEFVLGNKYPSYLIIMMLCFLSVNIDIHAF